MRILWVKGGKLLPLDTGGKIRSYNIIRGLAAQHCVVLLSYYGGVRDRSYESEVQSHFPGTQTIYTGAREEDAVQRVLDYVRRLFWSAPYAVSKFTSPKVARVVAQHLDSGYFDIAVCDFLSASLNFPATLRTPSVLFQHNVETVLWRRLAARESHPLRRLLYRIEARKMVRYESRALARFQHVIAVSGTDRDHMLRMHPGSQITVVPTGVDLRQCRATPPMADGAPSVVFTGSMDWEPNMDAAEYFCRDIWPMVVAAIPTARFVIVGRNPHPKVKRLASDSVQVTGTVPSVADYLQQAAVVVVPLRIGGGTRLKIFEAMAMGKALVSTTIGAEGLEVENGRNILIADSSGEFAESVIRLLLNRELRQRYEQAAIALTSRYDWPSIADRFADVLACARRNSPIPSPAEAVQVHR